MSRVIATGEWAALEALPSAFPLYRFDLGDRVYIGEADRLQRPFQHYRTRGPSHATNLRLNAVMLPFLAPAEPSPCARVTEAQVDIDGARAALDLTRKASRLLVESAALTAALVAGEPVENL